MFKRAFTASSGAAGLFFLLVQVSACQPAAKKEVTSQADLPRFTYSMNAPASDLVRGDSAGFQPFAAKVRSVLDTVLRDYDIRDKATMRALLSAKADLQQLGGDYQAALETVKTIRGLQEKPSARLMSGLLTQSELEAAIATRSTNGAAFQQAFT